MSRGSVEDGAGVEQVFMAVPHLQCPEYLFKHIDPVADAGVHPWFDLYRACALAGEMGSQLSFKMNPVDRPRLFLVGPVSVRFPCRQMKYWLAVTWNSSPSVRYQPDPSIQ